MSFFGDLLSGLGSGISDWLNSDSNPFSGLLGTNKGGLGESISNPSSWWDKFKNGETNLINKKIADENLQYQLERNEIEDKRYEDETKYNRTWAEEERDYSRALQQQIFDREDTALERQASSLSNMGINPLSQNMNGLGAGQAVSASTAPVSSGRGGQALHNDFQMQSSGMIEALGSILGLADTINGVQSGQYQRDALALQNDRQFLENMKTAASLGIRYNGLFPAYTDSKGYLNQAKNGKVTKITMDNGQDLFDTDEFKGATGSEWRKMRFNSMPNWQYTLDSFGQSDVYKQAEKALTNMSNLFDKASSNLWDKSIYELGDKNGKFNPFMFLLNMFGLRSF